ncbi:Polyphenol oxidase latent form, chloroplastic [Sesamum angolense]|uniref:Polyphenol oxidase latent form, chloroplastic n=1 Tax=Sesamum angolense TaxID=2727404 RepID=A0AAE1W5M5_9LAMI|nr:Polyphenol oxidase latent form, chloroplastic [Sesamum angolense]
MGMLYQMDLNIRAWFTMPYTGGWKTRGSQRKRDMGNFYSAGRDPSSMVTTPTSTECGHYGDREEPQTSEIFTDTDYLNSQFLFYDENSRLVVKVRVPRPRKLRTPKEKEEEVELLLIEDIEVDVGEFAQFNIFVDEEEDSFDDLTKAEFLGTFSHVRHKHDTPMKIKAQERLELNTLLDDLDVEGDEEILISLVPLAGDITIGGIKISFAPSSS